MKLHLKTEQEKVDDLESKLKELEVKRYPDSRSAEMFCTYTAAGLKQVNETQLSTMACDKLHTCTALHVFVCLGPINECKLQLHCIMVSGVIYKEAEIMSLLC